MKFEFLKKVGTGIANKTGPTRLKIKARSPEILLGLGIVAMGGAVVSAVVAGRKNDKILDDHFVRVADAKAATVVAEDGTEVVKTEQQVKTEVRKAYVKTAGDFAKNYALTAGLMVGSTACFVGMHNIQAGRIAGLTTAYTGVSEAFRLYQENNKALNGVESHLLCKNGFKKVKEQDEDGYTIEKTVMKDANDIAKDTRDLGLSPSYWVVIDSTNSGLNDYADADMLMLKKAEEALIRKVNDQGWAVVNDLLDAIGAERTTWGMVMGWVKGGNKPSIGWDDSRNNLLLAGHHNYGEVVLEFNVDGNVFDIQKKKEKAQKELTKRLAEKSRAERTNAG